MTPSSRLFERLYTMPDYHDRPRGGIANFNGRPHAYRSVFDFERDDYSDTYELRPVDDETLQLALEARAISQRWWKAYEAGETDPSAYPRVLEADRARHDEIAVLLAAKLAALPAPVALVRAEFRRVPLGSQASDFYHEVQWTPV